MGGRRFRFLKVLFPFAKIIILPNMKLSGFYVLLQKYAFIHSITEDVSTGW